MSTAAPGDPAGAPAAAATSPGQPALLPGAAHFQVIEEPAYAPSGAGEHLYVEIEKEGLTTDAVAELLARTLGRRTMDVGYAGRKDRHAITRQWFSVHGGEESRLGGLSERAGAGRIAVLTVARHGNKLRLGHLSGNRFRLAIGGIAGADQHQLLAERLARLAHEGIRNRFGEQRFGIAGATLAVAKAWGAGDAAAAVERIVDAQGRWRFGEALPGGFRQGPEGRVLGFLRRRADDPAAALRAAGDQLRKLVASAAQSAVFNAVLDVRQASGLLHRLRVGDLGCTLRGAPFLVTAEELATTNQRSAAGVLDAFATAPLPGMSRLRPSPEIDAEERAWSAPTGVAWEWFAEGAALSSPGERRPLLVRFRTPPNLAGGDPAWLEFALPSGSYATEVLAQAGIAVPADRSG
jgi:tRNA pseudouridine13 synthase